MDSAVYLFSIAYMINIYISEVCKNSTEKQAIGNKILLFTVEIKTFLWDFLVWNAFLILYIVETFQFEGAIFYPFSSFWDWFMRRNVIYGFSSITGIMNNFGQGPFLASALLRHFINII